MVEISDDVAQRIGTLLRRQGTFEHDELADAISPMSLGEKIHSIINYWIKCYGTPDEAASDIQSVILAHFDELRSFEEVFVLKKDVMNIFEMRL